MGLDINGFEVVILILIALFIFGPDRLPKVIGDGVRMLRQLRRMARTATDDLGRELGTDIRLEDLNPKALLRKHLLSEEDEAAIRTPMERIWGDLRSATDSLDLTSLDLTLPLDLTPLDLTPLDLTPLDLTSSLDLAKDDPALPDPPASVNGRKHVYDVDAT